MDVPTDVKRETLVNKDAMRCDASCSCFHVMAQRGVAVGKTHESEDRDRQPQLYDLPDLGARLHT
jgi:hypothetical protein